MTPRPESRPLPLPLTAADRKVRAARVAEIGRLVAEGRYVVPPDDVAAAVLEFHRRKD